MILIHYIQCIKYLIFKISLEFQYINVRRQKSSFRDNVSERKLAGKNGFIVDSILTDRLLLVLYSMVYFVTFSVKYHGKCLPVLHAYLNSCHQLKHSKDKHRIKPNNYRSLMNHSAKFQLYQ